ncbi:calbindin-32, putative [Ixodes scapularis]|uniref:Calbindin-32, putative n=1 Tax=Ixodes scapularis TaxID=6945 RepID=B7PAY9_IXOSC|nr:calbindin-32, putative [Ixodes scapularis]|eukprot:XP_002407478.1 calbindin-32, putative [Ixodes scapularis]
MKDINRPTRYAPSRNESRSINNHLHHLGLAPSPEETMYTVFSKGHANLDLRHTFDNQPNFLKDLLREAKKDSIEEDKLIEYTDTLDKNGTIENEELKGFLKDLLELVKKDYDAQDLEEFQEAILRGCDFNKDGKISKKELTMVLLALAKHSADEDGK